MLMEVKHMPIYSPTNMNNHYITVKVATLVIAVQLVTV